MTIFLAQTRVPLARDHPVNPGQSLKLPFAFLIVILAGQLFAFPPAPDENRILRQRKTE